MKSPQHRWARPRLTALALALLLGGCAGMQVHDEGMKLLANGQRDAAIAKLREANRLAPTNSEYRIDLLNATQSYGRELVESAEDARRLGKSAEAAELYAKAVKIDPSNERARRGQRGLELDARSAVLLAESERLLREGNVAAAQERVDAALADNPSNAAAKRQAAAISEHVEKARQARAAQAAAQSIMNKPVTLQFRDANLRMVFEALSRTTGLNVILDRDVRADLKTTIFVKDAAVEDTVDLILLQNQLEKRSLNANTLFIYPATAAKQKEYQDLQVRTFQVTNIDVKYLQTLLKTVLKVKDISVDERSGTLVMRDTADAIAVASKVIAAHDVPESEVMLEVEVLEVSHDRLSNLGIEPPTKFSISTPTSANTIGALKALTRNDLIVSPLGVGINFRLEDSDANLLASPRIRARNKEKARILIGDRVPIITNTVTPTNTGGGVVTGSVQYQDVGLKLEFEPQIYSDQEVGIRISLEVSSIVKEIAGPNGSLAYQIGTRNAQTVVRLRDGETQILGGLISAEDRNASARVPGVGHLPVVGRLFGNNSGTDKKTEVVLSITPRIVRPPAVLDASVRSVFSGTEGSVRERALQLDPVGSASGQASGQASGGVAPPVAGARPVVPRLPTRTSVGTVGTPASRPEPAPAARAAAAPAAPTGEAAPEAPAAQPPAEEPKAPQ
ncbi:MAG: secretion protein [Aquincola sp.]|nr:secretion protein [Aquincola sp.]MDH4288083.1 secretion protein [Aquincola sp.]MDH5331635.1 secretion protein [Aquincola sp.]